MFQRHPFGRILVRLSLPLVFLGCVHHAEASPPKTTFRVVVLGSSTAEGANASPLSSSWVNLYAAHLATMIPGSQVVNLAVGGYLTFNIMPTGSTPPYPWNSAGFLPVTGHNITAALALHPDLIIINLPTNDCDLHVPIDLQLENYAAIVGAAAAQGVPVWISTPQPRSNGDATGRQLLAAMLTTTFEIFPERTIDFWTGLADAYGRILPAYDSDDTHLNTAGHAMLYDRAVAAIVTAPPAYPSIAMHPLSRTVLENEPASFVAIALSHGNPSFRWQRNGTDIPGATSARHTIGHATASDNGAAYRCIVTEGSMSDTSNTATLTVRRLRLNTSD